MSELFVAADKWETPDLTINHIPENINFYPEGFCDRFVKYANVMKRIGSESKNGEVYQISFDGN